METDPGFLKVYREARLLMRQNEKGFRQAFTLDINTSEQRKRWRQQTDLPDYIKKGGKKFAKTNIVAYKQEFLVGPKSELSKQPTAPVGNAKRQRQQVAARLTAIKCSNVKRPRARTAVDRTGKRKRLERDLAQNKLRSKGDSAVRDEGEANPQESQSFSDGGEEMKVSDGATTSKAAATGGTSVSHTSDKSVQAATPGLLPAAAASAGGTGVTPAAAADTDPAAASSAAAALPVPQLSCGGTVSRAAAAGPVPAAAASAVGTGLQPAAAAAAAASGAAAAHSRGHSNSHPLVIAMQLEMEEHDWRPSVRVDVAAGTKQEKHVFGMKRPGSGGLTHVVRAIESPCTLNLAYDPSDGVVKIIKICSVEFRHRRGKGSASGQSASLNMQYYFVYTNERAQLEAEYQDDVDITFEVHGKERTSKQIGSNTLRAKAEHWKGVSLHHAGDIIHNSAEGGSMNLGNIVGTIAWVTDETLVKNGKIQKKLDTKCEKELLKSLTELGITQAKAEVLSQQPIFLSCHFGERRSAATQNDGVDVDDSDSDDDDSSGEDEDEKIDTGSDLRVQAPSLKQARLHTETTRASNPATCSKKGVGDGGQP